MSRAGPAPVLVAGAGPVGLVAALMIARHGAPVRIVDANDGPTDLSKAIVVWRGTLEALDAEVHVERFWAGHASVLGAQIDLGDRVEEVSIERGDDEAGIPAGLFVPQSDTERVLLAALERRGVGVERRTRLVAFEPSEGGVDCELEGPEGAERLRVPWLIGADGAHSTVRHGLGLGFAGESVARAWLLADVDVRAEPAPDPHRLRIVGSEHGVVALFPLDASRWRVIADLGARGADDREQEPTLEDVQRLLDDRTELHWRLTGGHWLAEFRVNERQVDRYVHGRVLLAGDAAHVHSPAGGQGMNTGIQDAANLAWKVALVQRGGAPTGLVQTYHEERHPVGQRVVHASSRLLRAGMIEGGLAGRLRSALVPLVLSLPPVQRRMHGFLTEDDLSYRGGPLTDGSGSRHGVRSGDGFPDVPLRFPDGPGSSYRLLREAEATLVLADGAASGDSGLTFGDAGGFPVTVRRIGPGLDAEDPEGRLPEALGARAALVRPDGVVATVADEPAALRAWVAERLLRG